MFRTEPFLINRAHMHASGELSDFWDFPMRLSSIDSKGLWLTRFTPNCTRFRPTLASRIFFGAFTLVGFNPQDIAPSAVGAESIQTIILRIPLPLMKMATADARRFASILVGICRRVF